MSEKFVLPVLQNHNLKTIESKPLVISSFTKRFFTLPKRSILVKPAPTNYIITTQSQNILHQPVPISEKKINKKQRNYLNDCKRFSGCCQKVLFFLENWKTSFLSKRYKR